MTFSLISLIRDGGVCNTEDFCLQRRRGFEFNQRSVTSASASPKPSSSGMDPAQTHKRRCESLGSEDSPTKRPTYLEPWIVNLLLDYEKPDTEEDAQFGHVLKVLNDAKDLNLDEKRPAVVLRIADGRHYIRVVVADNALQGTPCCLSLSGYSSIVGQFIILKNYRVCFREATKVEDCEFYLTLNCFQVTSMRRREMQQRDCNQEPSVLKRIEELWQESFSLQPSYNSESSVSEILHEIKEDKLDTLKRKVQDCLNLFDSTNQQNSEQLAIYPETKWQVARKQDKVHKNTFMVPAKFLIIRPKNEEILRKAYPQKNCQDASDTIRCIQGDDKSSASSISAESESLNDSLENPWDIFPEMTLTSSDISSTPPGLPHTQQVLLASPAEEEAPCSSSCTPDFLESCAHPFHCNSEQVEPTDAVSPVAFPSHKKVLLKESICPDSIPLELNTAHKTYKKPDSNESIPCGQPLRNSSSDATMYSLSPGHPSLVNDTSRGLLSENTVEDNTKDLKENKVTETMEGALATGGKAVAVKLKRMILDEDNHETFTTSTHARQKAARQTSTRALPNSNKSDKVLVWKPPLKFVSTPKKSRIEEIQVQHHPAMESNRDQSLCRRTERLQEYERNQEAAEGTNGRPKQQIGAQVEERVRRHPFHVTYEPPTPEVCSQVRSTRISRALLGWACSVFTKGQGQ
nr:PREDICTED: uncharacterized protein LOC103280044 [Anolis carolinensis]|eukprot:XP_008115908.1 PREDICTED: uncharacterized protein LOC103280044 [Anolis carolinensis]